MARAANTDVIHSVAASGDAIGADCTYVTLWDAANAGNLLWSAAITSNPTPLTSGEGYEIDAEALVINQTAGTGETEEMARRAVRGRVAGGVWVQYHSGAPGSGSSNIIPLARTFIAEAGFTIT